jgi:hypothetical protein
VSSPDEIEKFRRTSAGTDDSTDPHVLQIIAPSLAELRRFARRVSENKFSGV